MPIILSDIKCPVGTPQEEIVARAKKLLGLKDADILGAGVYKTSLDARKRNDIHSVCSVMLQLRDRERELSLSKRRRDIRFFEDKDPEPLVSTKKRDGRVVIAGFGPAGMFCALMLSELGYKPIVLERGADVDTRTSSVEGFFCGGELDPNTNVQFGEGGAGTFSDGKLTTRIGDPLCRYVLKRLVEFGAPEEIMYLSKPHIGTDKLRSVVKNLRQRVIQNGGEVRFLSRLDGISLGGKGVGKVKTNGVEIDTSALVLAIGHSARDTFEMLLESGVAIEPKAFSVGARIEHRQIDVDRSLYGGDSRELNLPKGEYQLSMRRPDGRAAYTFCMCPGGQVVAAASEHGGIVTNGMSEFSRGGENANAALVVSVNKDDFPSGALGGIEFAKSIERRAYDLTKSYKAPAMTVGAFLDGGSDSPSVLPTYRPDVVMSDLTKVLPNFVTDMMRQGLAKFSREMNCFGDRGALLTAPETRTSSPVRITRNEQGAALGIPNLYPCGEGAGYAGGIMSAAVDGIRTAMKIAEAFAPEQGVKP